MTRSYRSPAALLLLALVAGCTGQPSLVLQPGQAPASYAPGPVGVAPGYDPTPVALVPSVMAYGASCQAGFYQCLLPVAGPIGSQCTCPGLGGPSFGVVR